MQTGTVAAKRLCEEIRSFEKFDSELVETANEILGLIDNSPADASYLLTASIGVEIMRPNWNTIKGIRSVRDAHTEVMNYMKEKYSKEERDCTKSKYFEEIKAPIYPCPRY